MEFNKDAFSFLTLLDFEPNWHDVGLPESEQASQIITDLDENQDEYLAGFHALTELIGFVSESLIGSDLDYDRLMSIKVDDGGSIETVLTAAIFNDGEGGLVLKIGSNLFKVNQADKKNELSCGKLSGSIKITEIKKADDSKIPKVLWSVRMKGIKEMIYIPCSLTKENMAAEVGELEAEILTALEEDGESIARFLKTVPSGANFIKPKELEVGEYEVSDIIQNKPHPEYGDSFTVVLGNGDRMQTNKAATSLLLKNFKLYKKALTNGKPLTMGITSKEELSGVDSEGNPKVAVKINFWIRAPRELYLPISHTPAQLPAARLEVAPAKQAVAVLDEAIPF